MWVEDLGIRVTGVRNTQEEGVRMACPPEADTDYPGHDLQILTSCDFATCVRQGGYFALNWVEKYIF